MKKLLSALLAAILTLSLSVTAFAAGNLSMIGLEIKSGSEYIALDESFIGKEAVMPGDRIEETLLVSNISDYRAHIFFHVEIPDRVKENTVEMELIRKISMRVLQDGKEIYRGNLSGAELQGGNISVPVDLGSFKPGDKTKLTAVIDVPHTLDNSYALDGTQTKWIFTAEGDEEATPGTGDTALYLLLIPVALSAALFIIGCIIFKKRRP